MIYATRLGGVASHQRHWAFVMADTLRELHYMAGRFRVPFNEFHSGDYYQVTVQEWKRFKAAGALIIPVTKVNAFRHLVWRIKGGQPLEDVLYLAAHPEQLRESLREHPTPKGALRGQIPSR